MAEEADWIRIQRKVCNRDEKLPPSQHAQSSPFLPLSLCADEISLQSYDGDARQRRVAVVEEPQGELMRQKGWHCVGRNESSIIRLRVCPFCVVYGFPYATTLLPSHSFVVIWHLLAASATWNAITCRRQKFYGCNLHPLFHKPGFGRDVAFARHRSDELYDRPWPLSTIARIPAREL